MRRASLPAIAVAAVIAGNAAARETPVIETEVEQFQRSVTLEFFKSMYACVGPRLFEVRVSAQLAAHGGSVDQPSLDRLKQVFDTNYDPLLREIFEAKKADVAQGKSVSPYADHDETYAYEERAGEALYELRVAAMDILHKHTNIMMIGGPQIYYGAGREKGCVAPHAP